MNQRWRGKQKNPIMCTIMLVIIESSEKINKQIYSKKIL